MVTMLPAMPQETAPVTEASKETDSSVTVRDTCVRVAFVNKKSLVSK